MHFTGSPDKVSARSWKRIHACGPINIISMDLVSKSSQVLLPGASSLREFNVVSFGQICVRFRQVMVFVPQVYQSIVG